MNIYGCIYKTQKSVGLLYLHKSWKQKNRGVKGYSNGTNDKRGLRNEMPKIFTCISRLGWCYIELTEY